MPDSAIITFNTYSKELTNRLLIILKAVTKLSHKLLEIRLRQTRYGSAQVEG